MKPRSLGRRIRREVQPDWDDVHEARVLRKVLATTTFRRRRRWPWVAVGAAGAVVAAAIALLIAGGPSPRRLATESERSQAPMSAVPAADAKAEPRVGTRVDKKVEPEEVRHVAPVPPSAPKPPLETTEARRPPRRPERPRPAPAEAEPPDADALLRQADAARRAGELAEATRLLETFVHTHRTHAEASAARMSLARVLEQRGRLEAAARTYEALLGPGVVGTLREDARAGAARVWSRHGKDERARPHARTYLQRNPDGPHAAAMKAIVGP